MVNYSNGMRILRLGKQTSVASIVFKEFRLNQTQYASLPKQKSCFVNHLPCYISAIKDDNPVVYIDDRWLHAIQGGVPEEIYEVPIGKAKIRKEGSDLTLVGISYMAYLAERALPELDACGIDVELLDPRTIKPLDKDLIIASVKKTGRLVVADGGWRSFGVAAEVAAIVFEEAFSYMKAPVMRVTLPDCPAPASRVLEAAYYPTAETIVDAVKRVLE